MAGLRIRWRRDSSGFPADRAPATGASTAAALDVILHFLAALVILLALAARTYNLDWDENTHLHPDERFITIVANDIELPSSLLEYLDSDRSSLNPYNRPGGGTFVYGTFPLFLTKAAAVLTFQDHYDGITSVGRHLTAVFDTATVLFVFLLGRRIYGSIAGVLAALFYASAPLAIQHAHFLVVDPYMTFFVTAALYFLVRAAQEGRLYNYAIAGLCIGLGAACKLTALSLLPALGVAAAIQLWPHLRDRFAGVQVADRELTLPLACLALALVVGFLAFRVAQPYAFEPASLTNLIAPWTIELDQRFINDQKEQTRLLSGEIGFPPSVQWIGRASYVYPLSEMLRWGMAPAFAIAGWGGALYAAYRAVRFRELRHVLLLTFVLLYFGFMGRQFSLYLRYYLPLYPVLAVLAGFALTDLVRWGAAMARRLDRPAIERLAWGASSLVVLLAVLAGVAYMSIYSKPVTRLEASRSLFDNAPNRSTFAVEHWDDTVPMRLPNSPEGKRFEYVELALYEADTQAKVDGLLDDLDDADYVVLSSNRLLQSIPRNPVNYPVTTSYYELLFNGELGFRLLREFTSYPSILGLEFSDASAEESWSSYDHPRVLVFEKTREYSRARAESLLGQVPFAAGGINPAAADKNGLLLSAADRATQQQGGTWSSVFSNSGLAANAPVLLWLGLIEIASLAVLPIAFVLLRRLPDRGYLLAKPLAVLLLAYPVWLIVSLKVVHFEQTTIILWLIAMLAIGGFVVSRQRADIEAFVRREWRFFLFSELLFLGAFFFFLMLRAENPDLWHPYRGGEKPMDLAYLTAVTRSTTLPPYDAWFAGGYINYYYLGQFFTATLSKATTIPPEVAFNLAVPTYFALTLGAAFSVAYNLAASAKRFLRRGPGFSALPRWSLYAAGVGGAFFVTVLGNLDGFDQLADRLALVSPWRLQTGVPILDPLVTGIGGLWQLLVHGDRLPPFDFWRSSRMLPPQISITEFPYFSYLFADLHAHMMAIPFQVLAIGCSLSLVLGRRGERRDYREWAVIALLGLIVGSLRVLNSWDYPPFLLLALAAVVISERRVEDGAGPTLLRLVMKGALLGGVSMLAFKPFLDGYLAPVAGTHASLETTPVHQYLAHFGVFVAAVGAWLLYQLLRALKASPLGQTARPDDAGESPSTLRWLLGAAASLILLMLGVMYLLTKGQPLFATLLLPLVAVFYLSAREFRLRRADGGLRLFLYALVALALGLSIGVDLITINGDIARMNTVFKFYLHAWVFYALVASFASWYLIGVAWRPSRARAPSLLRRAPSMVGRLALVMLVFGALLYPIFATTARLDDRFADLPATLDGTAYAETAVYDDPKGGQINLAADFEGIRWLRDNVQGTPTIVEGRTDLYRWGGRFSIYTGLPAVIGWDWHQRQQRGDLAFMVDVRNRDVDDFFSDPSAADALRFLKQYNVRYVILGQVERLYYPAAGLDKFDDGLDGALTIAFENSDLIIFQVREQALSAAVP